MITMIYRRSCPNCGGPISADRLEAGLPCEACLPKPPRRRSVGSVARALLARGKLRGYAWLYQLYREYEEFEEYFHSKLGLRFWSAQRGWAKRLVSMESMEIVAPTGVGKTTLLVAYAAFSAEGRGWRILYLVPTENLVRQTAERLARLAPEGYVLAYYSGASKKARVEALERISRGDFRILVVTTGFLQRRMEDLRRQAPFDLVIVDDVDSLLRQSRNVERVLELMGYPREAVETALELVETRMKLYTAIASGLEDRARELQERVVELEAKLRILAPEPRGQLVIASATGRPKGIKHLVFRELLGFEVGGSSDYMRNVIDSYLVTESPMAAVVSIVKRLGPGGVVFVSQALGKQAARILVEKLRRAGVRAAAALAGSRRAVEALASGELDVIVGVASRYGVIVRGLDLPERIRYAVFLGAPARRMALREALLSPRRLLRVLLALADEGDEEAKRYSEEMRRLIERVPDHRLVVAAIKGSIEAQGLLRRLADLAVEASEYAAGRIEERIEPGRALSLGGLVAVSEEGGVYAYIVDAPTYLQASGRTSRLLRGAMTRGLSVVVERYPELIRALEERMAWYAKTVFRPFNELDLDSVLEELEASRKGSGKRVSVRSVLLVVESPTKARTIAWFWGRPSKRKLGRLIAYESSVYDEESDTVYLLTVVASRGHIYDLAVDEDESRYGVRVNGGIIQPVYTTIKRCLSCGHQYTEESDSCPRCGSSAILDSKGVVEALRKLAVEVDEVIVATDPDREGEKIAWDIALAIKPYNPSIRRARIHEITPKAVLEALRSPESFDKRLVEAQVVRRIEDRWIGFSLSKHLQAVHGKRWLGAGRVQTPVLGWVIERYREWKETRGYLVIARLESGGRLGFYTKEKAEAQEAAASREAVVLEASRWPEEAVPQPPFTTDSLLYEAQARLGMPAWMTMKIAQELFESGLITYHRTDSTRVSPAGMGVARSYLEKRGLAHLYTGRPWGEGGAHEAIRPTRPLDADEVERAVLEGTLKVPVKLTRAHLRLYDLIFRRFIASQMAPAKILKAYARIQLGPLTVEIEKPVKALGEGFTLVYDPGFEPWLENVGPGTRLPVASVKVIRASKVRLLTSGDLVRLMRQHGIGRPSTYAKAIQANIRHGYVIASKKRGYLVPTKMGIAVYEYLAANFGELVSVETTREMEEILDAIERGERSPIEALDSLWLKLERMLREAESKIEAGIPASAAG